ncbi:hypothetical protein B0H16DRAFT_1812172 [Mycena metata]|uniref:Uncharacterized protein n=1 Tax=Mycena metata TaxID=1033252 RepID=A0AAD7JCT1_9AGAR|nr:hypothetical protein B0H16DRAFT_1812172 [Mycena metata]
MSLPSFPPSDLESALYYRGLSSNPRLVARTGAPWYLPKGPWQIPKPKELRPVGNHAIKEVWEDDLALKIHTLLDSLDVKWTSTDVMRIAVPEDSDSSSFVVLWIGVMPESLSGDKGVVVVSKCREILLEYDLADVEVEIRESVVTRSVGPALLEQEGYLWPYATYDLRKPLTASVGLSISPASRLQRKGTGGFWLVDERDPSVLLLVTCRHVVLPESDNHHYASSEDTEPLHQVVLLGEDALDTLTTSVATAVSVYRNRVEMVQYQVVWGRADQVEVVVAQKDLDYALAFEASLAEWEDLSNRILGHVVLSPPIAIHAGSGGFTEDWALIKVDPSKIDPSQSFANTIDLGSNEIPSKYTGYPFHHRLPVPFHHLLPLRGTIPTSELRAPLTRDPHDEPALLVLKCGATTDVTRGWANNLVSYAWHHTDGIPGTSKEWAILSYSERVGAFSSAGDSGAVIVDGTGRIGGLLIGGVGRTPTEASDIAYATPIDFIMERMRENGVQPVIFQSTEIMKCGR